MIHTYLYFYKLLTLCITCVLHSLEYLFILSIVLCIWNIISTVLGYSDTPLCFSLTQSLALDTRSFAITDFDTPAILAYDSIRSDKRFSPCYLRHNFVNNSNKIDILMFKYASTRLTVLFTSVICLKIRP